MDNSTKDKNLPKENHKDSLANPISEKNFQNKSTQEIGGYNGEDPTKYGDWQHKGRVTDF